MEMPEGTSGRELVRLVALVLVALVVARAVGRVDEVLRIVVLAATAALLTAPLTRLLARRLPRGAAAAVTALVTFVGVLALGGTWIVPTMGFFESLLGSETVEALYDRPELRYASRQMANGWVNQTNQIRGDTSLTMADRERFLALRRKILKALHAGGVPIVLGSDSPQLFNAPGFSLTRELAAYVKAGLTPYQALATGTVNVARFLGNQAEAGTIAVGKRADLILLGASPLQDIHNIARKEGVMVAGRWLPKEEIDRRLADLVVR